MPYLFVICLFIFSCLFPSLHTYTRLCMQSMDGARLLHHPFTPVFIHVPVTAYSDRDTHVNVIILSELWSYHNALYSYIFSQRSAPPIRKIKTSTMLVDKSCHWFIWDFRWLNFFWVWLRCVSMPGSLTVYRLMNDYCTKSLIMWPLDLFHQFVRLYEPDT